MADVRASAIRPLSDIPPASPYDPQPIDTSGVTLPVELMALLDGLARNAHEVWARQRLRDGWTHGARRDDDARQHPCLVPYDELPDGEKEYDRAMARATLAAILAMGYRLVPPATPAIDEEGRTAPATDFDAHAVAAQVRASVRVRDLIATWTAHDESTWSAHPELYAAVAQRLIQLGEPLLAREVLRDISVARPDDLRLRHLNGLALARSGATLQAREEAESITGVLGPELGGTSPDLYEDAYGLLGRVLKDLALDEDDAVKRQESLHASFAAYEHAFHVTGGAYAGINAATMALLAGKPGRSAELARAARDATLAGIAAGAAAGFWQLVTLAEAALLLGDREEAARGYRAAVASGDGGGVGDVANTRRQIRLILAARGEDARWAKDVLPLPAVVVFSEERVDAAGGEERVRAVLRERLTAVDARAGFSSAAAGTEILFQEVLHELGLEAYVVLPYGETDFIETSVDADWRPRFHAVMDRATECVLATEQRSLEQQVLFGYASELLLGLAAIHARWLDARLVPVGIHDQPEGAPGAMTPGSRPDVRIGAVMFSDVVGFSRLKDVQVEHFVRDFLGLVGRLARDTAHKPTFANTWGDGLYFQFPDVASAGSFALELHDAVRNTDWSRYNLPTLALRTGLHAGPLFEFLDPVTGRRCLWGRHVTRAARIEPVTPPGEVYASQEFAALVAARGVRDFDCEPVGRVSLAKAFGTARLYYVRRRGLLRRHAQPIEPATPPSP